MIEYVGLGAPKDPAVCLLWDLCFPTDLLHDPRILYTTATSYDPRDEGDRELNDL